jgi:hypothetical protein
MQSHSVVVSLSHKQQMAHQRCSCYCTSNVVINITPNSSSMTNWQHAKHLTEMEKLPQRRCKLMVEASWNMMAHVQKPYFVFRRNRWVHLNQWGRQFSRLLAAEVCALAVVMLDTPCSEVVWRVLATHSIRQFPSCASLCAITFQLESTCIDALNMTSKYIWPTF